MAPSPGKVRPRCTSSRPRLPRWLRRRRQQTAAARTEPETGSAPAVLHGLTRGGAAGAFDAQSMPRSGRLCSLPGHLRDGGTAWTVVVCIGRKDGRPPCKWYSGFDTKKQAEARLTDLLRDWILGDHLIPTQERISASLARACSATTRGSMSRCGKGKGPSTMEGPSSGFTRFNVLVAGEGFEPPAFGL